MAHAWWRDNDYALFNTLTKERDAARAENARLRGALRYALDGATPEDIRQRAEAVLAGTEAPHMLTVDPELMRRVLTTLRVGAARMHTHSDTCNALGCELIRDVEEVLRG